MPLTNWCLGYFDLLKVLLDSGKFDKHGMIPGFDGIESQICCKRIRSCIRIKRVRTHRIG